MLLWNVLLIAQRIHTNFEKNSSVHNGVWKKYAIKICSRQVKMLHSFQSPFHSKLISCCSVMLLLCYATALNRHCTVDVFVPNTILRQRHETVACVPTTTRDINYPWTRRRGRVLCRTQNADQTTITTPWERVIHIYFWQISMTSHTQRQLYQRVSNYLERVYHFWFWPCVTSSKQRKTSHSTEQRRRVTGV